MSFVASKFRLNQYPKLKIGDFKNCINTNAKINLGYHFCGISIQQTIQTTTTPCNFGNVRYWWLCPNCGKRVGVLYCDAKFACRHCIGASYESQLARPIENILSRLETIHKRLQWHDGLLSEISIPKGMHLTTFDKLIAKRNELITQFIGQLTMLNSASTKPKKKPSDYTLDDIFSELDHAKFMAGMKGNTAVLAVIPILKARLLGLDKSKIEELQIS